LAGLDWKSVFKFDKDRKQERKKEKIAAPIIISLSFASLLPLSFVHEASFGSLFNVLFAFNCPTIKNETYFLQLTFL
jgi:hypothetical protein